MGEVEFQHEVLKRLGQMEAEIKGLKVESITWKSHLASLGELLTRIAQVESSLREIQANFSGWKNQQEERYVNYNKTTDLQWAKYDAIKKRLEYLEQAEHRRRGGIIVIGALLTAAGALGALMSRIVESIQ